MKLLSRIFLKGLAFIVPVAGTIAIIAWAGGTIEAIAIKVFGPVIPSDYNLPGVGILLGIAFIFAVGLLAHLWIFSKLMGYLEAILARAPLIKAIYGSLKDFSDFVWPSDEAGKKLGKPLLVRLKKMGVTTLGFEMVSDLENHRLGEGLDNAKDKVAVYLPMSYQIGGYMAIIDRADTSPLDMDSEDALRLALTSGVTGRTKRA